MIIDHTDRRYMHLWENSNNKYNGAYFYSKEIVANIIPNVETDRNWVTIHVHGLCANHSVVFIHNNLNPHTYSWTQSFDDLVLVCGVPETMDKMRYLGTPLYLPLSVDVPYVESFSKPKTKDTAYVGRPSKRMGEGARVDFPAGTDFLEGIPRRELLSRMAEYEKVYAVGRCAIEAKVLGCEVLPYDPRFPDPSIWQVLDNRDAAKILQEKLDEIDRR